MPEGYTDSIDKVSELVLAKVKIQQLDISKALKKELSEYIDRKILPYLKGEANFPGVRDRANDYL